MAEEKLWLTVEGPSPSTPTLIMSEKTLSIYSAGRPVVTFHKDGRVFLGEQRVPYEDSDEVFLRMRDWFKEDK